MNPPDTFCSRCGARHAPVAGYPKACDACGSVTYANPTPVPVALCPVGAGVLCVRRGIPPHVGKLALIGGFQVRGETWRQAAVREILEETGQCYHADDVRVMAPEPDWDPMFSTPNDNLLLFVELPPIHPRDVVQDHVDPESLGSEVVREPVDLAFPAHSEALRRFLTRDTGRHAPWSSAGMLGKGLVGIAHSVLRPLAVSRLGLDASAHILFSPSDDQIEVFVRD